MINKITLIGRIGNDPEVKNVGETKVGRLSLATSESYKDKNGEFQESTEWHNIVLWRDLAERAEKSIKKGSLVYVEGKVTYRKYTGTDNVERSVTDIIASSFRVLDGRKDAVKDEVAAPATSVPQNTAQAAPTVQNSGGGEDLPF
jgi:single-strand DNA-binding protein